MTAIPKLRLRRWCLAFLLTHAFLMAASQNNETVQHHIARLIKEAAQPELIHTTAETSFDTAFKLEYHDLIRENHIYAAALKRIDAARIRELGTPQSLAAPRSATLALDQLHSVYAAEIRHEQRVQQIYTRLRHVFETAQVPSSSRAKLLEIFRNAIAVPSSQRQRCIAAEKSWIVSMDELYQFANEHSNSLSIVAGTISIEDPVVRDKFNHEIISEELQRKAFLQQQNEYAKMQAKVLDALGIDAATLGLQ